MARRYEAIEIARKMNKTRNARFGLAFGHNT
jgi:hypothetical protein